MSTQIAPAPVSGDMPAPPNLTKMSEAFEKMRAEIPGLESTPVSKVVEAPTETVVTAKPAASEPVKPADEPKKAAKVDTADADIDLPEGIKDKSPAAKDAFRTLTKERNEAQKRIKELEREMAERAQLWAKPNPEVEKELTTLRQQTEELNKKLKVNEVTNSAELTTFFKKKYEDADLTLRRVVGTELAPRLAKILRMENSEARDESLNEVFAELSPSKANQLGSLVLQYDAIASEREKAIADAETNAELILQRREKEQEQLSNQRVAYVDGVFNQLTSGDNPNALFQRREGDDSWNAALAVSMADARELAKGNGTEEQRLLAYALASRVPAYHAVLVAQGDQITKLKAQIEQLRGSSPTISRQTSQRPDANASKAGTKFQDRVMQEMG